MIMQLTTQKCSCCEDDIFFLHFPIEALEESNRESITLNLSYDDLLDLRGAIEVEVMQRCPEVMQQRLELQFGKNDEK